MTPCDVHPHATGGEAKTIGLFPRDGETREQAYARWRTGSGHVCTCDADELRARIVRQREALIRAVHSLRWVDGNWTKPAADRGAGLPSCRSALAAVEAALK